MKFTFLILDKYNKNAYADLAASIGLVPENNSSKMQKCLAVLLAVLLEFIISKISLHRRDSAWNKLSRPLVSGIFKYE